MKGKILLQKLRNIKIEKFKKGVESGGAKVF